MAIECTMGDFSPEMQRAWDLTEGRWKRVCDGRDRKWQIYRVHMADVYTHLSLTCIVEMRCPVRFTWVVKSYQGKIEWQCCGYKELRQNE